MEEQKDEGGMRIRYRNKGGGVWLAHTKDEAHRCAHNGISPLL